MASRCLLIFVGLGVLISGSPALQNEASLKLTALLRSPDADLEDELARAAIEAGPAAVPALRSLLSEAKTEEEQFRVLVALAFIGGRDAVSIIKKAYDENRELAPALAIVLPSVDSKENRKLLLHLLDGDPDGEHGAIDLAALSLGLLRAREARKPLREIVKKWPGKLPSEAAEVALEWIQRSPAKILTKPVTERERVIAAVLQHGLPEGQDRKYAFDEEANGYWRYGPKGWIFARGDPDASDAGGPSLEVFISSDGMRAIVSTTFRCGMLCGSGHDYLLRKEGKEWKVRGFLMTWVS